MSTGTETRYVSKKAHMCVDGEILDTNTLAVRKEDDSRVEYNPILKFHEKAYIVNIYDAITPATDGSGDNVETWVRLEVVESEIKSALGRELEDLAENVTRWGGVMTFDMFIERYSVL